jgi:exodeoxyribonuclease V alpha subunit
MKGTTQALITSGKSGILQSEGHSYLRSNTPGIVVCAYTRRAVANIRKNLSEDMQGNCITIHKLLEYQPVYYDIIDPETGKEASTMRFEPTRNADNNLPTSIHTIVIEEASMVSVELYKQITDAIGHKVQFIFLGDIQQLPPVFGSAILGFKMLELPTIELTQVYRQALESPIIRLAHRVLSGVPIPAEEYPKWSYPNQLTIHPWKKKLHPDTALLTVAKFFTAAYDKGAYDQELDAILIPFNKSCGTDELNKHIANHISISKGRPTYEIVAGFNKLYLSVGDKVLYDKEDAIVTNISLNSSYHGKQPQPHSVTLDYWGYNGGGASSTIQTYTDEDIDFILEAAGADDTDRLRKSSHIVTLLMQDTEREVDLDSAAELNALNLGYALTVHKSQGSEWRKVFFILHQSHATMLQRELLYTGITRAKQELYIICEPESLTKGIINQRIKGNTLAQKAEYFKGKLEREGG